jgi:hypothetical protein
MKIGWTVIADYSTVDSVAKKPIIGYLDLNYIEGYNLRSLYYTTINEMAHALDLSEEMHERFRERIQVEATPESH